MVELLSSKYYLVGKIWDINLILLMFPILVSFFLGIASKSGLQVSLAKRLLLILILLVLLLFFYKASLRLANFLLRIVSFCLCIIPGALVCYKYIFYGLVFLKTIGIKLNHKNDDTVLFGGLDLITFALIFSLIFAYLDSFIYYELRVFYFLVIRLPFDAYFLNDIDVFLLYKKVLRGKTGYFFSLKEFRSSLDSFHIFYKNMTEKGPLLTISLFGYLVLCFLPQEFSVKTYLFQFYPGFWLINKGVFISKEYWRIYII